MNITSEDIKDMLEANSSLGLTFADNLYIGRQPSMPDDCVTIFDTPGSPPQLTLAGDEGDGYYYPSVQIQIRKNGYKTGLEDALDIEKYLHGKHMEVWNDTTYVQIKCTGEPFLLDWDENERARFVLNFDIHRKP